VIPFLKVKNPVGRRRLHGRMEFRGLPISIENAKSSSRQWYNPDVDKYGISRMDNHYGYVQGTLGVDGDAVDVYVGPDKDAPMVYVVHQLKAPDFKEYDEDKCMVGFPSAEAAKEAYCKHYNCPDFFGSMTEMPFEEFKEKLTSHKGKMIKSHIKGHLRHTKGGGFAVVKEHTRFEAQSLAGTKWHHAQGHTRGTGHGVYDNEKKGFIADKGKDHPWDYKQPGTAHEIAASLNANGPAGELHYGREHGQLKKSHIQAYTRTTETGKTVFVAQHEDKRRVYIPDNSNQRTSGGNEPVIAPSGRDNFGSIQGEIAAKIGLPPGPIKLLQGKQFGEHSGFGKQHMHEQHGAEIRAAGFKSEEEFVADVVKNYSAIYDAGGGRYALVSDGSKQKVHILEISRNKVPPFYSIITGYITDRPKFTERNFKLLWKKGGLKKGGEEMCRQVGNELGVDWKEVDFDEFADGMFDEDEHGKGSKETARIVLDHLKEDPKYYTKLKAAGLAKAFPLFIIKREEKCSWLQ
jgi:hypothetical protein